MPVFARFRTVQFRLIVYKNSFSVSPLSDARELFKIYSYIYISLVLRLHLRLLEYLDGKVKTVGKLSAANNFLAKSGYIYCIYKFYKSGGYFCSGGTITTLRR